MKPDWHEFPTCAGWWWLRSLHIMKFFAIIPPDSYCEECGPFWGPWTPPPFPAITKASVPTPLATIVDRLVSAVRIHIAAIAESDDRRDWHDSGLNLEIALGEYEAAIRESADAIFEARADGCHDERPRKEDVPL